MREGTREVGKRERSGSRGKRTHRDVAPSTETTKTALLLIQSSLSLHHRAHVSVAPMGPCVASFHVLCLCRDTKASLAFAASPLSVNLCSSPPPLQPFYFVVPSYLKLPFLSYFFLMLLSFPVTGRYLCVSPPHRRRTSVNLFVCTHPCESVAVPFLLWTPWAPSRWPREREQPKHSPHQQSRHTHTDA